MRNSPVTNSSHLQTRLRDILRNRTDIRFPSPYPWDDLVFDEMANVVEAFLQSRDDVVNDSDPLVDWADAYKFHRARRSASVQRDRT